MNSTDLDGGKEDYFLKRFNTCSLCGHIGPAPEFGLLTTGHGFHKLGCGSPGHHYQHVLSFTSDYPIVDYIFLMCIIFNSFYQNCFAPNLSGS